MMLKILLSMCIYSNNSRKLMQKMQTKVLSKDFLSPRKKYLALVYEFCLKVKSIIYELLTQSKTL